MQADRSCVYGSFQHIRQYEFEESCQRKKEEDNAAVVVSVHGNLWRKRMRPSLACMEYRISRATLSQIRQLVHRRGPPEPFCSYYGITVIGDKAGPDTISLLMRFARKNGFTGKPPSKLIAA